MRPRRAYRAIHTYRRYSVGNRNNQPPVSFRVARSWKERCIRRTYSGEHGKKAKHYGKRQQGFVLAPFLRKQQLHATRHDTATSGIRRAVYVLVTHHVVVVVVIVPPRQCRHPSHCTDNPEASLGNSRGLCASAVLRQETSHRLGRQRHSRRGRRQA